MQLFIDKLPAIPISGTSIKLTEENPFYTKSASYTYEVELPTGITENRAIYDLINRLDTPKKCKPLPCILIASGHVLLEGVARITSLTQDAVKVQLFGSTAAYNYMNKFDDTYINKLPIGTWFEKTIGTVPTSGTGTGQALLESIADGRRHFSELYYDSLATKLWNGTLPWVVYPTYNAAASLDINPWVMQAIGTTNTALQFRFRGYDSDIFNARGITGDGYEPLGTLTFCPQPYIWAIAKWVAEASGFNLADEDNALYQDPFLRRIFYVNTFNGNKVEQCLPHWSVNEFWTNIENAFGVVMVADYKGKSISLQTRADHYGANVSSGATGSEELKAVVNEYTITVADEEQRDKTVSNVAFADYDEHDPAFILSEYIRNNAEVNTDFADLSSLAAWAEQDENQALAKRKNVIYECADGRRYIYCCLDADGNFTNGEWHFSQVDMLRPSIGDPERPDDIDIELKFIPARIVEAEIGVYAPYRQEAGGRNGMAPNTRSSTFTANIMQVNGASNLIGANDELDEALDIEQTIIDESSEDNPFGDDNIPDLMPIAIANLDARVGVSVINPFIVSPETRVNVPWRMPAICEQFDFQHRDIQPNRGDLMGAKDPGIGLSLTPVDGLDNLYRHTGNQLVGIDTSTKCCISFISERMPSASSLFYIRGKAFVCEKIEASIEDGKLSQYFTGYFYPIDLTALS